MRGGSGDVGEFRERIAAVHRLLQNRVRLAICVLLSRYDRLSFSRLKELTGETDGSLGAHLRRIEDEGYLKTRKRFVDRKPVTWYALTPRGRAALDAHLEALAALIRDAAGDGP